MTESDDGRGLRREGPDEKTTGDGTNRVRGESITGRKQSGRGRETGSGTGPGNESMLAGTSVGVIGQEIGRTSGAGVGGIAHGREMTVTKKGTETSGERSARGARGKKRVTQYGSPIVLKMAKERWSETRRAGARKA